ncbi:TetR/AcrR family transcriptional regulator C-terminal domain-containing protein [Bailinhaonella thermotolerans]|uniref:TetR/AcrR family transcriptional regulator C-terminal domain-containing protein n=1 Tax=Bailinhaonella thermotolerans TaxID=1070861 RepID=UPI00192A49FD|nr:TetR/AcrR family transcriptional regulator C-terminal domain-containing protein [Bailinhaonella thermotolerans]
MIDHVGGHVVGQVLILDGLVERVLARAFTLQIDGDWRRLLREFAGGYRRELLRHPGLLPLAATRPVTTPDALRMLETGAAALRSAGFELRTAMHLLNAIAMFTVGHCLAETDPPGATPQPQPQVDPALFPNLAEALHAGLGTPQDHQERFDVTIDALINGFDAARPRSRP